jgi:hypothetical protein
MGWNDLHFGGSGSDYEIVTQMIARYLHETITEFGQRLEPLLIDFCMEQGGQDLATMMKEKFHEHPIIQYDKLSQESINDYIKRANLLIQALNDVGYMITTY